MTNLPLFSFALSDCNDPAFQFMIITKHAISKATFDHWRDNYDVPGLAGKKFLAHDIDQKVNDSGVNCDSFIVEVKPVGQDQPAPDPMPGTNGNLEFNVNPGAVKTYSVTLFRGLLSWFRPDRFEFYKVRKGDGSYDIIFSVIRGDETVYYGDVSNDQP